MKRSRKQELVIEPNMSSAELCQLFGMNDVQLQFTEEDHSAITNAKVSIFKFIFFNLYLSILVFWFSSLPYVMLCGIISELFLE